MPLQYARPLPRSTGSTVSLLSLSRTSLDRSNRPNRSTSPAGVSARESPAPASQTPATLRTAAQAQDDEVRDFCRLAQGSEDLHDLQRLYGCCRKNIISYHNPSEYISFRSLDSAYLTEVKRIKTKVVAEACEEYRQISVSGIVSRKNWGTPVGAEQHKRCLKTLKKQHKHTLKLVWVHKEALTGHYWLGFEQQLAGLKASIEGEYQRVLKGVMERDPGGANQGVDAATRKWWGWRG